MVTALHRCPECSKTFPSNKALHGHLRLHPDRSYRGVNPPNNSTKSCKAASTTCSTTREGSDSDANKSSEMSPPDNSPIQYKQIRSFRAELEAFYKDWDTEKYYEGDGSQYEARYIRTLNLEEYDPRFKRFCKRLLSKALEEEEEGGIKTTSTPTMALCNGMGHGMSNGMINATATKANIESKKRKLNGIETNASNGGQHVCVTCKKTFDSHQALGGHQTLHRQKIPAPSPSAVKEAVEAKVHICKTCKREFSSGQALGGHQRLHFEGPLNRNSAVKGEVEKGGLGTSPARTHGSLGLAANGDEYEYEEGEIPPSPDDSTAVQLEPEEQATMKDEGSKDRNLAALQLKLEMQVEVEDEVTVASTSTRDITIEEEKVVEEGEEKGAMVTTQTHVDPRSVIAQQDRNIYLPSPQPPLPRTQLLL